ISSAVSRLIIRLLVVIVCNSYDCSCIRVKHDGSTVVRLSASYAGFKFFFNNCQYMRIESTIERMSLLWLFAGCADIGIDTTIAFPTHLLQAVFTIYLFIIPLFKAPHAAHFMVDKSKHVGS